MGHVGPNRQDAISRETTALIEIVRLLARKAASEWTKRRPEVPPFPLSEKQS
jgi:hypothetical protein